MPNPNEGGQTNEGREIIGKYNDIYFGDPSINGHIDSPHAENFDPAVIENMVSSGSFRGSNGEELRPPASKRIIYANKRLRRLLFARGRKMKWGDIPAGGVININGTEFEVKSARRDFVTNERQTAIVHPSYRAEVTAYIKSISEGDLMTGEIANDAHESNRATVIVSKVNRHEGDLNRAPIYRSAFGAAAGPEVQEEAIKEYREMKKSALMHGRHFKVDENGKTVAVAPYLHIALHGKKDLDARIAGDGDIIIGTLNGKTCDADVQNWFDQRLNAKLTEKGIKVNDRKPVVKINTRLSGDVTKIEGRKAHLGNYNTIQLEVCRYLRDHATGELGEILTDLLKEFTEKFVSGPDRQVSADTSERQADVRQRVRQVSETAPDVSSMIETSIWSENEGRGLTPRSDTIYLNESMRNLLGKNVGDSVDIPGIGSLKIDKARRAGQGMPFAKIIVREANKEKVTAFFREKMR